MKLAGLKGFLQPKPVNQIINKAILTPRPRVQQYWDALQQRDSYRAGCQDFQHAGVIAATHAIAALKANRQWPETIPR